MRMIRAFAAGLGTGYLIWSPNGRKLVDKVRERAMAQRASRSSVERTGPPRPPSCPLTWPCPRSVPIRCSGPAPRSTSPLGPFVGPVEPRRLRRGELQPVVAARRAARVPGRRSGTRTDASGRAQSFGRSSSSQNGEEAVLVRSDLVEVDVVEALAS